MKTSIALIVFLGLLPSILFSQTLVSKEASGVKWGVYLDTSGSGGSEGVGFSPSLFIPIEPSDNEIVLIDLRGHLGIDKEYNNEGNGTLAVGYRKRVSEGVALGTNGSIDLFSSPNGNVLAQASLGLEFFSKYVDVAMNFYAPIGGARDIDGTAIVPYARIDDNELKLVYSDDAQEVTRYGLDLTLHGTFPILDNLMLILSGGVVYHFGSENYEAEVSGKVSTTLEYEFDLFGHDASTYVMADAGYDGHGEFDFMVSLGFKVKLGGSKKKKQDERRREYDFYKLSKSGGFVKSQPSVATVDAEDRLHIENATTLIDGKSYRYIYEGDANDNIVTMIDGSKQDALVVLNGDAGEINITQSVKLKDGQHILGEGRALVVSGPDGRTAVLLVGGSHAVVNQEDDESNIFELAADTTVEKLTLKGGKNAIYIDAGHDAKLIDLNITDSDVAINGEGAGVISIENATISNVGTGVKTAGAEKVVISSAMITATQALDLDTESVAVNDSEFTGAVKVVNGNGDVNFFNVSANDSFSVDSEGDVTLNGVAVDMDLLVRSNDGAVKLVNADLSADAYVSAKYLVEILSSSVAGSLTLKSDLDEVIMNALHVGGDLLVEANTVHGLYVTTDGKLYVNRADKVYLDESSEALFDNYPVYYKDGVQVDWDADDDGTPDDIDPCPMDADAEPVTYYLDVDGDGVGVDEPSINVEFCPSDDKTGYADVAGDVCPSDENASKTTYYLDSDGDGVGVDDSSTNVEFCPSDDKTGYAATAGDVCPADNNATPVTYYLDSDGDGVGVDDSSTNVEFCPADDKTGYSDVAGDVCPADNNATPVTYYLDSDGDGVGVDDSSTNVEFCPSDDKTGYSETAGDVCPADSNATPSTYYLDSDGDGVGVDEASTNVEFCPADDKTGYADVAGDVCPADSNATLSTYYLDSDGDGVGVDEASTNKSFCPSDDKIGYAATSGDLCPVDSSATTPSTYYIDSDGDGVGVDEALTNVEFCPSDDKTGYAATAGDLCPVDSNVTTPVTYYLDYDGDGRGDAAESAQFCPSDNSTGYVLNDLDVNDHDYDNDGIPMEIDKNDNQAPPAYSTRSYSPMPPDTARIILYTQAGDILIDMTNYGGTFHVTHYILSGDPFEHFTVEVRPTYGTGGNYQSYDFEEIFEGGTNYFLYERDGRTLYDMKFTMVPKTN